MEILDGKLVSQAVKDNLKLKTEEHIQKGGKIPHLAAVLVGNDGASETYVASKIRSCAETGFKSSLKRFDTGISENDLISFIEELNNDDDIDGILVQLPLPRHIDEQKIIAVISPDKDVDGFHPISAGRLMLGLPGFIPATPYGIMLLLEHYKIETSGKQALVIGRSNIVGRPMSILLSRNSYPGNCTVTLAHSRTNNLSQLSRQADIIVAALGRPGFLKGDMVKEGAVIIDVGITRIEDKSRKSGYRLSGDVDFDSVAPKSSYITPVPGGVGLMTIAALLMNTFESVTRKQTTVPVS